jgi:heme-degrading monooxygenase HmoA
MFVRVTDIRTWPGQWSEYEGGLLKVLIDSRHVAKGRLESWLVQSTDADEGFVISIWESEDAARAYETSEYLRGALPKLEPHIAGEYGVRKGEVRFVWDSSGTRSFRQSRW